MRSTLPIFNWCACSKTASEPSTYLEVGRGAAAEQHGGIVRPDKVAYASAIFLKAHSASSRCASVWACCCVSAWFSSHGHLLHRLTVLFDNELTHLRWWTQVRVPLHAQLPKCLLYLSARQQSVSMEFDERAFKQHYALEAYLSLASIRTDTKNAVRAHCSFPSATVSWRAGFSVPILRPRNKGTSCSHPRLLHIRYYFSTDCASWSK